MSKSYKVREKVSNNIVEQLLHNRGLKESEREAFLNPDFENHLHDPFLLPDMEKSVERILKAIEKGEKIAVWTDYDADGIPGAALMHDFFRMIGYSNFINYIPDRHLEGYGLNLEGVEKLKEEKVNLMITIDCGIRDHECVDLINKLGMEVIVTDHHEPGETLPEAFAVINHKRKDSIYPEQVLCGSGVAWKLVEAILKKKRSLLKEGQEKWLLDLAGIATLSDMVPLTGENRVLSHFGLSVLRKTRRPGLAKLYAMLKINKNYLSEDDVGFLITPRINAASRMGVPRDAFELLVESDEARAESMALHLDKINKERKVLVAGIVKEANKHIKQRILDHGEKPVIVMGDARWRPALLGLAANSIAEEYRRPVFLWGRENGKTIKGSCRSDGSTDLVAIMERASDHLSEFGGHKFSGGFSVSFDKIHTLEEAIIAAADHTVLGDEEILLDSELQLKNVNEAMAREINRLSPFGTGNAKPIFLFTNILPEKISRFGKGSEHLSINLRDGSHTTKAISFFTPLDKFGDNLVEGKLTNLAATIELSYFNPYRPETRLRIVDFF